MKYCISILNAGVVEDRSIGVYQKLHFTHEVALHICHAELETAGLFAGRCTLECSLFTRDGQLPSETLKLMKILPLECLSNFLFD